MISLPPKTPWQTKIEAIDQELANIDKRRAVLLKQRSRLTTGDAPTTVVALREDALLPNERVTRKNRIKLEVMGRIRFYLKRTDKRSGLTSAELYDRIRKDNPFLSFDTFRSYLSRFKAEGRLTHNPQHKLWNLATEGTDSVENN